MNLPDPRGDKTVHRGGRNYAPLPPSMQPCLAQKKRIIGNFSSIIGKSYSAYISAQNWEKLAYISAQNYANIIYLPTSNCMQVL